MLYHHSDCAVENTNTEQSPAMTVHCDEREERVLGARGWRSAGSLTEAEQMEVSQRQTENLLTEQLSLEVEDHPANTTRTSRNVDTLRHI